MDGKIVPKPFAPIEKHEVKEVRKDVSYIASMLPQKGQKIFKFDSGAKSITIIQDEDYETSSVAFGTEMKVNRRLIIKKGCMYVVAINRKNAIRKFKKLLKPNAPVAI